MESSGCSGVISAADQCSYLKAGNCAPDGYINYLELYYCSLDSAHWFAMIIFLFVLVVLFFMLGTSAEDYFCPTLGVISDLLRLSPDVAGITILALGNGAPDVFSTFVAVTQMKFELAIGELTGAGVFVSLVVVGAVTLASSATVEPLPFIRDTTFYLLVGSGMLVMIALGSFHLYESISFLLIYAFYVSLSVAMNVIKNRRAAQKRKKAAGDEDEPPRRGHSISYTGAPIARHASIGSIDGEGTLTSRSTGPYGALSAMDTSTSLELAPDKSWKDGAVELWIIWLERYEWGEKTILQRIVTVLTFPITIVFDITIPQVQEDTYYRPYNAASMLFSPLLLMTAFSGIVDFYHTSWAGGWVPLWGIIEVVALGLALLVFFTTKTDELPRYNFFFVGYAFLISIVWIYIIANELVDLLEAIGLVLEISPSLLGMTVLAWGNSIGDLVSNVVVARQGSPAMAIAACFGGPLFNMLVGLGTSLTYRNILDYPDPYEVALPTTVLFSFLFVIISMVSTLIVVPVCKFKFIRPYAIYTIALYLFFTACNLMVEFGLLPDDVNIGN
eukprot:TRINITY_DN1693_c0_g1_i2.p1 TRINITY_DN1693_c0_g1~~TRINITY_DN1693_c0_g1_i2.p1  ORF type:complete len:648 (-),score=135.92 TRINITY_DN1693_c0_g1_i2:47-1723(-)